MRCSRRSTTWSASVLLVLAASTAPVRGQEPRPAAVPVTESEARHAVVSAVKGRMGDDVEVRIETVRLGGVVTPGEGTLVAVPEPGARLARPIRFSLSRRLAGNPRGSAAGYAVASVFVSAVHVRATGTVARGEAYEAADLVETQSEVGAVLMQRLPRLNDVVGSRAVRDVAPDEVITRAVAPVRTTVRSGDVVRLAAAFDGVRVETEGVAEQSGDPGDTIRVVNRASRRSVRARVTGPGRVEVVQ